MIDYPRHSDLPQRSRELLAIGFGLGKSTPWAMDGWLSCQWEDHERKMTDAEYEAAHNWCIDILNVIRQIGDRVFEVKTYHDFWEDGDGRGLEDTATVDTMFFDDLMAEVIDHPFWQAELFFAAYMGNLDQLVESLLDEVDTRIAEAGNEFWEVEE